MEPYLLDTNVASYILNGELWQRQLAMVMAHCENVYAVWRLADKSLADTITTKNFRSQCMMAYAWVQERVQNGGPPLYLSLKV